MFRIFKFDKYTAQVSLRDPNNKAKYIGSDENWEKAENAIIEAAKEKGLKTVVEYGEAAFYGPKLDFMVKDAIGRKWQLGTIQVDYNLPERFQLEYTDADGSKKRPIMIHRAPFGSIERFLSTPADISLSGSARIRTKCFLSARNTLNMQKKFAVC